MNEWEIEQAKFLEKIGQVAPVAVKTTTTKKDEE